MQQIKKLVHVPVLLVLAFCLFTGIRGVDFGLYWDDETKMLYTTTRSIQDGILLPRWYNYPSMSFDLMVVALVPDVVQFIFSHRSELINNLQETRRNLQTLLSETTVSNGFKLRVRVLFMAVSVAAVVWTYLLVLAWGRKPIEALLASSLIGLSWELAYHVRWIAPDGIMMQFGALTLTFLVFAQTSGKRSMWLRFAAISAGLACGTKYPGGLLFLPVLVAAWTYMGNNLTKRAIWRELAHVGLLFGATYLVTSPGTVLEPVEFVRGVVLEIIHYRTGHNGYTVKAGGEHFGLMFTYLALVVFSKHMLVSVFFFGMALIGMWSIWREDKRMAVIMGCFPLGYILYMSLQKTMIVRNLLVLIPFLAIYAARGCVVMHQEMAKWRVLRGVIPGVIGVSLLVNSYWLIQAAESIRNRSTVNQVAELARYLDQHGGQQFLLSKRVKEELSSFDKRMRSNVGNYGESKVRAVFFASEHKGGRLPSNWWNRYAVLPSGPFEVNFNYYPSWRGDDRIVIGPVDAAREVGVVFE